MTAGGMLLLAGIGAVTALELTGVRGPASEGACGLAGMAGLILFAVGLQDVLGHRAFRRLAERSRVPPWTHVRGASTSGEIRTTALRPAHSGWRWVVRLMLVSSVVAYLALPLTMRRGGMSAAMWMGVSIFACALVLVCLEVFRGKARGRVEFPVPFLLLGETAEVLFQIDRCGAELPPESVEFTLRCVQAQDAFGGLLRKTVVAEAVAPSAIRFVPGEPDGWELTFRLRDDLPGADLLGTPPTYWELVVEMAGQRSAYHQAFLAPVFSRSQTELAAGLPQSTRVRPPPLTPIRRARARKPAGPATRAP